jgi:hypothetical protein
MTLALDESVARPDGIIQLLDDHHVVVLCDHIGLRRQVGKTLRQRLGAISETRVIELEGAAATDLVSLYYQFERQVGSSPKGNTQHSLNHWWRDLQSIVELLRHATPPREIKREYFIWHDADVLLEHDLSLFGSLVNSMLCIAAEREHVSLDRLVLQRVVFLGGAKLGAYAEDPNGQLSRWLEDQEGSPFWEVMSVIDRPPVITFRVEG